MSSLIRLPAAKRQLAALLAALSIAFAGCSAIGLESGDCYVDDYQILSVVD